MSSKRRLGNMKRKHLFTFIFIIFALSSVTGQNEFLEGEVSYLSSQNVYVKFRSTDHISLGDTLYFQTGKGAIVTPAIVVTSKSSISCVGKQIAEFDGQLQVGDKILAINGRNDKSFPIDHQENIAPLPPEESGAEVTEKIIEASDEIEEEPEEERIQKIRGRLSASMYSNMSTENTSGTSRMRYSFSMRADHIDQSRLSLESNLSFRHRTDERMELSGHLNDYLKVYSLAANYALNKSSDVWLGRKTNINLANMGAIDGIQFEKRFDQLSLGTFVGFRPDFQDFGVNTNLMQAGFYLTHESKMNQKRIKSTLAIVEQKNHWNTDRRFIYLQHSSTILKNLNAFTSFELDLFENIDNHPQSVLNLSSIYFSLRYRASKKLTLFGSFDARKNVIYYESYKSYIDQLVDQETRQGFRMRVNYRPVRYLSMGLSGGYRSQKNINKPSKNLMGNVTYSRVPFLKLSATASATLLQTAYLDGRILGIRLTKEIIKGKVNGGAMYRNVHYRFLSSTSTLDQNIAALNLSWRIQKRVTLSVNFESTFEKNRRTDRIRLNLTKRIKS